MVIYGFLFRLLVVTAHYLEELKSIPYLSRIFSRAGSLSAPGLLYQSALLQEDAIFQKAQTAFEFSLAFC